jgi:lysyl-tRNA synthetase class 2
MLTKIRRFFDQRGVLEVETPLLAHAAVTDPNLHAFTSEFRLPGLSQGETLYLQTSPEFAMKRLLAAGSGSIFQICKAFRNEEAGRYHNPEFTLLEWYRPGFGLEDLIAETDALLACLLAGRRELEACERISYRALFARHTGLDPIHATTSEFAACAERHGLPETAALCGDDRSLWLDLLFSHRIQPSLGLGRVSFVQDYPACLPSLAQAKPGEPEVVERVEVFIAGLELANGYHELADAAEQAQRFDADLAYRRAAGLPLPPQDRLLLAALAAGLPDCSGIALGLDRLLMLLTGAESIDKVLAFPAGRN